MPLVTVPYKGVPYKPYWVYFTCLQVHPRPSTFGYVAAARVPGEGVDVAHIVCEAEAQLNFSCFDWFASARKK